MDNLTNWLTIVLKHLEQILGVRTNRFVDSEGERCAGSYPQHAHWGALHPHAPAMFFMHLFQQFYSLREEWWESLRSSRYIGSVPFLGLAELGSATSGHPMDSWYMLLWKQTQSHMLITLTEGEALWLQLRINICELFLFDSKSGLKRF